MAEKYGTIISIAKILVVINMKKLQLISLIMLALSISGMAVNAFLTRFPDWAVRAIGVLMLIALFAAVSSSIRIVKEKK